PFIPFITEEIHQQLVPGAGSIMVAPYPEADDSRLDAAAEADLAQLIEVVTSVRNLRGEMNLPPSARIKVVLVCPDANGAGTLTALEHHIVNLVRAEAVDIAVGSPEDKRPAGSAAGLAGDVSVFVPLAGLIDFTAEEARLQKEIAKLEKDLSRVRAKLGNEDFLQKAPAEVVRKEKDKAAVFGGKLQKLTDNLAKVRAFMNA
ncbi:MAG: class I tRNA ligase family protein, partial [Proteobacteria bacterium]|nr:class I tRNA ligase family protein [Pseudomonadota bacterium]